MIPKPAETHVLIVTEGAATFGCLPQRTTGASRSQVKRLMDSGWCW